MYRYSPIQSMSEVLQAITYIHTACNMLCMQSFGRYLPNAGNVALFCHDDEECAFLKRLRQELTEPSDNPDQKYFRLYEPIVIPEKNGIPETLYTHLYIRKPREDSPQVGDVDFYLQPEEFLRTKQLLLEGKILPGARIYERPDLDMIELFDSAVDVLGYVSTPAMTEQVRVKLSDATIL